jgi:hypothetical protein
MMRTCPRKPGMRLASASSTFTVHSAAREAPPLVVTTTRGAAWPPTRCRQFVKASSSGTSCA